MRNLSNFLLFFITIVFGFQVQLSIAQGPAGQAAQKNLSLTLPLQEGSLRFLAIGDTGSGTKEQNQLAQVMVNYRQVFPYQFVIMMGDNIYGSEKEADMKIKFEQPYKPLLDGGVQFYASLGNHDEANQRFYEKFNMKGDEYYRFNKDGVSFYALNSNYMDKRQVQWLENELSNDSAKWKIAFMHHPPYSSGAQHGSSKDIREIVEPLFLKYGVDVVFTGHEHFYERIKPQKGIYYFITGAGGKLRDGNIRKNSELTDKGFDQDLSFMLIEIWKDDMYFQVISRAGNTVDSGVIKRRD